ncbi:BTB/POZ domain-containing protein 6-like [Paramacrobiotus metropolitanus]|uniref:BTB/POZ domain-containing protein 6-like n=1 Tax=Paramacrobiotus metropolitanus TaxID=2943436 RepID=UPI002445647F|nr:BTB/POZ domain-containing protein 6-like [Paramacrobiotus metropolitanus]
MSTESRKRKKDDWHSSKQIRKRTRYLFDHPDAEIPSDVTFLVGNGIGEPKETFNCHKFILGLVSSMFQQMFYGAFPQTDEIILIPDISPTAFRIMLHYAYGDNVADNLTMDNVMDTLYCAKKYLIDKLARRCRDFVQLEIGGSTERVCFILEQARRIEEDELAILALAEIAQYTDDVMESDAFLTLSLSCVRTILDHDHLSSTEPTIYKQVCRWARHNTLKSGASLRESMGSLFDSIRFPVFTIKELADAHAKEEVFVGNEERDLFRYLCATEKPDTAFIKIPRVPPPTFWFCHVDYFYSSRDVTRKKKCGFFTIEMRPDLAPECCAMLKELIQGNYHIRFGDFENEFSKKHMGMGRFGLSQKLVQERSVLSHSATGAVWFEWDLMEGTLTRNVRIVAWKKPSADCSAVFGRVHGSCEDFQQFTTTFKGTGRISIRM